MAGAAGMSQSAVSRIWRAFGLKPHIVETWKLSTDPQFVTKVRDVVGIYLAPPENALVLAVDEKSQIQALDRTQPVLPMAPTVFPHVWPHRCRHTFSMRTLEYLVTGHYRQAANLVKHADADAALIFYLTKADPLLVLRDLLGHSTVLTTEKYLNPRELHQTGEKPQVAWSRREVEGLRNLCRLAA